MPRQARIDAPGALHHIICRGIERRAIFRDEADKSGFIDRLGGILKETCTPCYAWALMPNHFHLTLRTGKAPVSLIMRRLLTGYAVSYNRKYRRHGHLFQNRYKSILCQEDPYLLELVRYIHLNPLRAGLVSTMKELDRYAFCGHSVLMGRKKNAWQDLDPVLSLFGKKISLARREYREFVEKGIPLGKRPELIGGGLIRSSGGWQALKDLRSQGVHLKSDERMLGDGDFVESVLKQQNEEFERRYRFRALGYDFQKVIERVGELLGISGDEIIAPSKRRDRVVARSLVCFWSVREIGMQGTRVAALLGMTQPAVSRAVARGERNALERQLTLDGHRKA